MIDLSENYITEYEDAKRLFHMWRSINMLHKLEMETDKLDHGH